MRQKALQKLLARAGCAGIYRLPSDDRAVLEKTAAELGFACFRVNLAESGDIKAILAALGRGLGFPEWYGGNFDALNDCLTDFSWREAPGYVISLAGAGALHTVPVSLATLNEVFAGAIAQWREQNIPLWIFYEFADAVPVNGLARLPTPT